MNDELDKLYTEYEKAVYLESSIREGSFLPITLTISGVEVKQFTPYHYILLDFSQSPFLGKSTELSEKDIMTFLWIVSADFKENDKAAKETFEKQNESVLDDQHLVSEIFEYLDQSFLDLTPIEDKSEFSSVVKVPYMAWIVGYVDRLASEYGWQEEYILKMPFAKLLQYIKSIDGRKMEMFGQVQPKQNRISDPIKWKIRDYIEQTAKSKE